MGGMVARAILRQADARIFADSGHGVAFQNRRSVTATVTRFLQR